MSMWSPEFHELMYDHGQRRGGTAPRCDVCGRFARMVHLVYVGGAVPEPDHVECDRCRTRRLERL